MNTTERDPLLYRDGTAQSQRLPKAMMPDYVAVDERTITEAFTFIQAYAKELNFYDLTDTVTGDWSSFFNQDIKDIIAFLQDPSVFANDPKKETELSQPHLVLLLTFLQLLEHQKEQANTLTKKHLDFYHHEALQMTKKAAIPDQVNVSIELDSRNGTYELKAGTLFYAGRDNEGNDLLYESQVDTLINHAEITQLKTLYNDKEIITLRDTRLREGDIMELMELAVGDPNPGDPLPPYPPGINSLQDISTQWEVSNETATDETIENAIVGLMNNRIFIAQERQLNEAFKGVLNTTIENNLGGSGLNTISYTIDNPTKTVFGNLMLVALYSSGSIPVIDHRELGRDLLLIMEEGEDVLFDLIAATLQQVLTDMDSDIKVMLTTAIDDEVEAANETTILDYLSHTDKETLNRVLNEAIAKADAKSNEAPLAESVGTALYTNDGTVSLDTYTQAATHVLGTTTKKNLNVAMRTAINTQAGLAQQKIVDEGITKDENKEAIEDAIGNYSTPEGIAGELIKGTPNTATIINDATTGLLADETPNLISLAVQLAVEQTTLKTIPRQEIATATQIALTTISLSQQLIDAVIEDIQLNIIAEEVTGMPGNSLLKIIISPEEVERRQIVEEIINQALTKVTQQTLSLETEESLITAILGAIDISKMGVGNAITTVNDDTIEDEALINTNDALEEVITIAKGSAETAAQNYCYHQLYMDKIQLKKVLTDRAVNDEEGWEECYIILEDANKSKIIAEGTEILKYKREEGDTITAGRGFQDISEYCWGQPGEEDPLPPYPEGADTLDDVYEQLQIGIEIEQEDASNYIRYELFLTEVDFHKIMDVKDDSRATKSEWDEVYELMEIARIKRREISIEEPQKEMYGNFYATPDVTQTAFRKEYEDEASNLRWKTFGANALDEENSTVTFADIGFAISSSVLNMEKGRRNITWTMAFEPDSYDQGDMEILFEDDNTTSESEEFPFAFAVTTPKEWVDIAVNHVRYGTCITRDPENPYDITDISLSSGNAVTKTKGASFIMDDIGGYLVWGTDGSICRIDAIVDGNQVKVTPLETIMPLEQRPSISLVKKYGLEDIYFYALQFELSVDEKEEPIAALATTADEFQWPILNMLLRNIKQPSSIQGLPDYYINYYNQVENLKLEKACLKVSVAGLNEFTVGNDDAILKSSSPFEPFGNNPEAGSTLYFAHPEIAYKKLDTLHIDIEWAGAPDDFKTHYENYWRVDGIIDYPYMNNAGYTAQLSLNDRSAQIPLESFECTETFLVGEFNGDNGEGYLLNGTPISNLTATDFKARAEDGSILDVTAYNDDVKSQYIVINTEGRSIGDTFIVTYGVDNIEPLIIEEFDRGKYIKEIEEIERLNVYKIGNRVTFYLKKGVQIDDQLKNIKNNIITWTSWDREGQTQYTDIQMSGAYQSAQIIVDNSSEPTDSKITITYPASGNPYLFSAPNATNTHKIDIRNISNVMEDSGYKYTKDNSLYMDEDVREWARFWELSLNHPDFYHNDYSRLSSKQQLESYEGDQLLLNPPYTPKINKMTFAYTALATIDITTYESGRDDDLLLYAHPFGYGEIFPSEEATENEQETDDAQEPAYYFFPEYKDEGHLYMGFEKLETPNNLSILFQMAEGSANPDLPKAEIQWSYLSNNLWIPLGEESIPYDHTNGLVNTGIINFILPKEATNNNTAMPKGLHWLKATTVLNSAAVCDTIGIQPQSVNAVLANPNEVPPNHLTELLPEGSITKTVEKIEAIEKVNQPYTSYKGKPEEQDADFYIRVGERIRHKNRLLTLWDYERMVLEKFTDVYKAKTLFTNTKTNTTEELGMVEVIVVPDIKGKLPFNPFEPKVATGKLLEIQEFLSNYLPQSVTLVVRNAHFTPIKVRFAVRFREGYNEGVYKERIDEDLKKYLSPWAYDQGAEIIFGSRIYPNSIIDFLEGLYYVDYITRIKIFQAVPDENGEIEYTDVRLLQDGENVAFATMPDEILMSAMQHEIDVITSEYYDDSIYRGINYMKIELDFIVEMKT